MTHPLIQIENLTISDLAEIGRELTPYRAEFRGKVLCAVDLKGDVIIRGLLRYSGQKDNYVQVLTALNLTYNRGQVNSLGISSAVEVVRTFLTNRFDGPAEVLDVATTFICDDLELYENAKKDSGKALNLLALHCIVSPMKIIAALNKAESMILIDKLQGVAN